MTKKSQPVPLEDANEKYNTGEYGEAIKIYKKLANEDNEEAALKYAYMLHNGEGVEVSKIEAAFYFKKLADYKIGDGFESDEAEKAQIKYANMLSNGDGIRIDEEEAVKYYEMVLKESEESDANKIFEYGEKLYEGTNGFIKDIDAAKLFYEKAAKLGSKEAQKKYKKIRSEYPDLEAKISIYGNYNEYLTKGKEEYKEAKEGNEKNSGEHYRKAANFFMKAANQGSNTAMFEYSKMLENGIGIEKDEEKAAFYCREAAAKGNIEAIFEYAKVLDESNILEENKKNTGKFYKLAADFYLKKVEDYEKAIESKSSFIVKGKYKEQSIFKAENTIMSPEEYEKLHENSKEKPSVEIDNTIKNQEIEGKYKNTIQECDNLAVKYYRKAAHRKNLEAMIKYAKMLEKGIGVDKDEEKAVNYYKEAAELGSKEAKDKLKEYNKQNTIKQDKFRKITVQQQKPKSILINDKSKPKEESLEDIRKSLIKNYSENIERYIKALYRQASLLELDKNNKVSRTAVKYYKTVLEYCENKGIKKLQISDKETIDISSFKNKINELDTIDLDDEEQIKRQLKEKFGYEFNEELGRGAEGTVYLCKKKDRNFVIKIPNKEYIDNILETENFETIQEKREKWERINLNIDNGVTKLKDAINIKDDGKMIDFQIEIYDLEKKFDRTMNNPFSSATHLLANLNNLHNISNVIHADFKQDNILLDNNNNSKIADFGRSFVMGKNKENIEGTPLNLAPELSEDGYNNTKTDVYAYGTTVYEIFTGKKVSELLEVGEEKKIGNSQWLSAKYAQNIDKKITKENIIDKIDFTKIFPNVNFSDKNNTKLLNEVQTELLKFFKGTLTANSNERSTTNEAMAQFRKVLKKCQKMVKTNGENLDLTEDLGIPEQDLYHYGIFNSKIIKTAKRDYISNIENLLNDPHLISKETIECLKALLNNTNEKEIDISFDNNFRKNLKILKEKDKTKYLLITKEMIELEKLKLASKINELKKQKNEYKSTKNRQKLKKVRDYRRKLKELYNMSDMIIKIKQNKEMAKHLLSLESDDRIEEFKKACKNNNIFAVKVLFNSANKEEKEAMIGNINVCPEDGNTMLYNLLNKDNMDKDDIRDAEFLIANGASFGKNILCYNDLSENIKNNLRNNLNIIDEDGKNYTLSSMLNFVSNKLNNNILSNNLEELKDIDKLLGINEESKAIPQHS